MLDELEKKFNSSNFSIFVEKYVSEHKATYMEAILQFCENHDMEPSSVATLVKKSEIIRSKLEAECRRNNLLEKTAELPFT